MALAAAVSGVLAASLLLTGVVVAAPSAVQPVSQARTPAWVNGTTVTIQYAQDFFCDSSVASGAPSGCEVGQAANHGPVPHADRSVLYVLVPLFANPDPAPMCAQADPSAGTGCPNHPLTIDLARIAGALGVAPGAVADVPLPAHSHILDGPAGGWWEVPVIGVTSQACWSTLAAGKDVAAISRAQNMGCATGAIPTNLYLFFNVIGKR
ncbi:MAG: hypothetical protein ACRDGL_09150 [Candidatus Limnocylindrales bacterium]